MRNFLLTVALIAAPTTAFFAYRSFSYTAPVMAATEAPSLGDMSAFTAITTDVQALVAKGELAAAATRITDLETAWDDAEKTLRPINTAAWDNIDGTTDDALTALRAGTPDAAHVKQTLDTLISTLANPVPTGGSQDQAATTVSGIVVTGSNGRALPCETMLETLRNTRAEANPDPDLGTQIDNLETKGTERCNADDDARADAFFAQAIALIKN